MYLITARTCISVPVILLQTVSADAGLRSYEALAEKMVNCIYNGSVKQRIRRAQELASLTEADGGILFAHWGCKGTIGASSLIKILWKTQDFQPWSWTVTAVTRPIPVTARYPHDFRHIWKCCQKVRRKNGHDTLRL